MMWNEIGLAAFGTTLFIEFILILIVVLWGGRRVWKVRKVKPQIAICTKCKYVVKTSRLMSKGMEKVHRCRLSIDMVHTDFVTGKVTYPKYSCRDRNQQGTCTYYKKVWWRWLSSK